MRRIGARSGNGKLGSCHAFMGSVSFGMIDTFLFSTCLIRAFLQPSPWQYAKSSPLKLPIHVFNIRQVSLCSFVPAGILVACLTH